MGYERSRSLTVAADGPSNFTAPISLKMGGKVTISGTITGAVTLQRRGTDMVFRDATTNAGVVITYTAVGTYDVITNFVQAEYRLNAKAGAVSAFPFVMQIEGN